MRRTSCVLLLALAVTAAAAGGASARCARSNPGGVLGGRVGVLPAPLKADVVVDQRGGGDVTTIADALGRSSGTRGPTGYFVIHIREGVYDEHIVVPTANVVFIGDGREKTILTGSRSNKTGHNVQESATLSKPRITPSLYAVRSTLASSTRIYK
jgi:pectin methylesterase-like acyl-CoA thioesterase